MAHPMMAKAKHDERAGQLFTRDLKSFLAADLSAPIRSLAQTAEARLGASTRASSLPSTWCAWIRI